MIGQGNGEVEAIPDPEEEEVEEEIEYTWKTIPVPADPGMGMVWEFQEISDNFEYEAPAADKGAAFNEKWDDAYHNPWLGPPPTVWKRDHSFVSDAMLHIVASRPEASDETASFLMTFVTTATGGQSQM